MNKVNLIKSETLQHLLKRKVTANKDQITVSQNGDETVLEFANEVLVFYIANGFPVCAWVPLRPTPMPV